mmetsp:Transcript_2434/g.6715  ORF Transcript_2434/g.6715 Transcript_2434/m.6715 type:complete len:237 (-) Transcript_2434:1098-1808(-)
MGWDLRRTTLILLFVSLCGSGDLFHEPEHLEDRDEGFGLLRGAEVRLRFLDGHDVVAIRIRVDGIRLQEGLCHQVDHEKEGSDVKQSDSEPQELPEVVPVMRVVHVQLEEHGRDDDDRRVHENDLLGTVHHVRHVRHAMRVHHARSEDDDQEQQTLQVLVGPAYRGKIHNQGRHRKGPDLDDKLPVKVSPLVVPVEEAVRVVELVVHVKLPGVLLQEPENENREKHHRQDRDGHVL